jgi:hypothetical protein
MAQAQNDPVSFWAPAVGKWLKSKGREEYTDAVCEAFEQAGYPPHDWVATLSSMPAFTFEELVGALQPALEVSRRYPQTAPTAPAGRPTDRLTVLTHWAGARHARACT